MIDMTAYRIDAVGPPWRYILRKDGEPVFVSPEVCKSWGDAVRGPLWTGLCWSLPKA
jgi:hypothetical protein